MWTLLAGWGGRLAVAAAAIAAVLGGLLAVRRGGVAAQQRADLKQEVNDDAKANEARTAVDRLGPGAAAAELHDDWQRR